ncbi:MAG: hypothetical protein MZU95_02295 [Desulfomicrobium escambiense]|nr:hypothetical protein [Desulfomicrobium escambiense]
MEDVDGERRGDRAAARRPRASRCAGAAPAALHFGPVIDLSRCWSGAGETGVPAFNPSVCPACSRRNLARRLAERHFEQHEIGTARPGRGKLSAWPRIPPTQPDGDYYTTSSLRACRGRGHAGPQRRAAAPGHPRRAARHR